MKCGRGLQAILAKRYHVSLLQGVLTVRAVYRSGVLVTILMRKQLQDGGLASRAHAAQIQMRLALEQLCCCFIGLLLNQGCKGQVQFSNCFAIFHAIQLLPQMLQLLFQWSRVFMRHSGSCDRGSHASAQHGATVKEERAPTALGSDSGHEDLLR